MVDSTDYPLRNETTAFRIIDNEAVILDLESGVYYSLNEVGSAIWSLCDGSKSIKDISTLICEEFEVEKETAEKDVLELLNDLVREGLVTISEDSAQTEPNQRS